jgi:hypothetical protein
MELIGVPDLQGHLTALPLERPSERDHREHEHRRDCRDGRRREVHGRVDVAGPDVLLEEQLRPVRNGLEDAERADAVRADPGLHLCDDAPLAPDQKRRPHKPQREGRNGDDRRDDDVGRVH